MLLTTLALGSLLMDQKPNLELIKGRKLVFAEEFNRNGLVNAKSWTYEVGKIRNQEAQYYTKARKENARVEGGNLVLEARLEPYKGSEVTSASITTKKSWTYGYFEVRAMVPSGKGTWPAAWFLGDSMRKEGAEYIPWPRCGEVDLMEHWGLAPKRLLFSVHCQANHEKNVEFNADTSEDDAENTFHVYGLDWKPEVMDFYYDGKLMYSYKNDHQGEKTWPFDKPMYMILNLAIEGKWRSFAENNESIFPAKYLVDYVRVYQ